MKPIYVLLLLLYIFLPINLLPANEEFSIERHLKITGMENAQPPHVFDHHLVLSYEADHPVRYVAAAFSHEQFNTLHTFVRNDQDVFVLTYPLTEETATLRYRLIVDGLWMSDPLNPNTMLDEHLIRLSVFEVPELPSKPITGPEVVRGQRVKFYYRGEPNRRVYLTGNFNSWDPFMYPMQEQQPGFYTITVHLPPGEHFYYFVSNGEKQLDPFSSRIGSDFEGNVVSRFTLRSNS